jgi:hypothetical protein
VRKLAFSVPATAPPPRETTKGQESRQAVEASVRKRVVKPIGWLVRVGYTHCWASTSRLSTWWSTRSLMGMPGFGVGFPLRCFQRLSVPNIATGRCRERDNPYTRGSSDLILSY